MCVPGYPLEREDVCRVVGGEHRGNRVDDRLRVDSLEPPAREALLAAAATAEHGSARVALWGKAGVQVELSPALWAVKHAADPVGRLRHGPAPLVRAVVRHVHVQDLVGTPPQGRFDNGRNLVRPGVCLAFMGV